MSRKTLYLLGIVATIVIGTIMYLNLCSDCAGHSSENSAPQTLDGSTLREVSPPNYSFVISDGNFAMDIGDNFDFQQSSPSFLMPISKDLKKGIEQLKSYMLQNDGKQLTLIGHHLELEKNSTPFPNLGLARANSVKNHLVLAGIPAAQIAVLGKLDEEMDMVGDVVAGAVSYALDDKKINNP